MATIPSHLGTSLGGGLNQAWNQMYAGEAAAVSPPSESENIIKLHGKNKYRCRLRISDEKVISDTILVNENESTRYYSIYVASGAWRGFTDKTLPDFLKIQISLIASYKGEPYTMYDLVPSPYDDIGWPLQGRPDGRHYAVIVSNDEINYLRSQACETFPVTEMNLEKYHNEQLQQLQQQQYNYQKMAQQQAQIKQYRSYTSQGTTLGQSAWNQLSNITTSGTNIAISPHLTGATAVSPQSQSYTQSIKDWWHNVWY